MLYRSYVTAISLASLLSVGAWANSQVSADLSNAQAALAGWTKAGQVRLQDTAAARDNCRATSNCVTRDLDIRFWGYYYYQPAVKQFKMMIGQLNADLQQPGLAPRTVSNIHSTISGMQNFIDTQKDTLAKLK